MSTIARLTGAEFDAMVDRGAFDCIEGKKIELIRGDIPSSRIHLLSQSNGKSYRKIEIALAPQFASPLCLPSAQLDLSDLFSVT